MGPVEFNTEFSDIETKLYLEKLETEYQNVITGLDEFIKGNGKLVFALPNNDLRLTGDILERLSLEYAGGMRSIVENSTDSEDITAYWAGAYRYRAASKRSYEQKEFYVVEQYTKTLDEWHERNIELNRAYIILEKPNSFVNPPLKCVEEESSRLKRLSRKLFGIAN